MSRAMASPPTATCSNRACFYRNLSYRADTQGEAIVNAVIGLLQSGDKPGSKRIAYYTTPAWVKSKDDRAYCFTVPKDAK